ncbi:MAG: hypothetical protein J1F25_07585, partial [Prevotellaceae bacterium]|nr:hypothetical protein [Prevotellaceae bacterium]
MKFITNLKFMVAALLLAVGSTAWAVTFDFSAQGYANQQSFDGQTIALSTDVSMSFAKASGQNAPAYYTQDKTLRTYAKNTFTVTATKTIESIKLELATSTFADVTVNTGTYSRNNLIGTWEGSATSVVFTNGASGQTRLAKITVVLAGEEEVEIPLTEVENIAAFKALEENTEAKLTLVNAQVNRVYNGSIYIQDATGGLVLYNTNLEIEEGTVINGTVIGKRTAFNGQPQLGAIAKTAESEFTPTSLETLAAIEATIAGLDYEANLLKLHTVKNVSITKEGNNYYAVSGEDKIQIYDQFKVLTDFEYPEFATIKRAILGVFNSTYELFPLTAEDIVTVVKNEGTNLDFEETTAVTADVSTNGSTANFQTVEGWTYNEAGGYTAGAVFAYGSDKFLGAADFKVPAEGPNGETTGNALGLLKGWGGTIQYTQDIYLPAGKYVITVPVYNAGGTTAIDKNLIGITIGETEYYATAKLYAVKAWKHEVVAFDVEEDTEGTLSVGYEAASTTTTNMPHMFIDEVNIQTFESDEARDEYLTSVRPVAEGVYYLYNEQTDKFMSRGSSWGTRAAADEYGLPLTVGMLADNQYTLSALDNSLYYTVDGEGIYTDKGTPSGYVLTAVEGMEGTYTLTTNDNLVYIDAAVEGFGVSNGAGTDNAAASYWKFLTVEEYAAVQARKQADADAAVAEAASIPVAALATIEAKGDATTLTFATGTGWNPGQVISNADKGGNVKTDNNGTEVFQGTKKFTQSVAGLAAGLYKVTIQGFYRGGARERVKALYDQGYNVALAYLTANATQIRLANWAEDADEKLDPNGMGTAKTAFDAGDYAKSGLVYVGEDGKLDLAVTLASYIGNGWLMLGNVTYVPVEAKAYNVTVAETENGTVTADKETALVGEEVALTITPDKGYELTELTVKTGETAVELTEDNTFIMPEGDVTVTATFAIKPVIAEGVYYIYNELTGKFMSRGSWWGTRAVLDEYGLP